MTPSELASQKSARASEALVTFRTTPLDSTLSRHLEIDPDAHALEVFRVAAARVPAYRRFLDTHGVAVAEVLRVEDFSRLPVTTKENYHRTSALAELCLDGELSGCDMLAFSS